MLPALLHLENGREDRLEKKIGQLHVGVLCLNQVGRRVSRHEIETPRHASSTNKTEPHYTSKTRMLSAGCPSGLVAGVPCNGLVLLDELHGRRDVLIPLPGQGGLLASGLTYEGGHLQDSDWTNLLSCRVCGFCLSIRRLLHAWPLRDGHRRCVPAPKRLAQVLSISSALWVHPALKGRPEIWQTAKKARARRRQAP